MSVVFKAEEFYKILPSLIPLMTAKERSNLKTALSRCRNDRDVYYVKEYIKNPKKWRFPKVSFDTFLDDPYFLGVGDTVYPGVRRICREIVEGGYREGVEVAGIGAGKSFSSQLLACYAAHHLLCLRNPHDYYDLSKDKAIAIINMGINATQALEVVFTGIKSMLLQSPFFTNRAPRVMNNKILFAREKVLLTSGNSRATTPLGYNVFYAILDEAAFYMSNDDKDVAQDIYESLQRRIVSRFGNEGLIMMISSPRYVGDFIMKHLEYSKSVDEHGDPVASHIYSVQLPTWKVKTNKRSDVKNKFYFHKRTGEILTDTLENLEKQYKVNKLEDPDFDYTYDVWEIPGEYKESFKKNPDKAKRDFGATPTASMEGFFANPTVLTNMWADRPNPVVGPGKYEFEGRAERTQYYVHLDLGLNRKGKGDCTGMAMGHFDGRYKDEETGEVRMKYKIDFTEQIKVKPGETEIQLADVRRRLYDLKAMGYNIALVTLDGFQSKDTMQILKKKGFKTAYRSVDREIDPYNLFKEAVYEGRIDIAYDDVLAKEIAGLELVNGIKVDHPPFGSKDVADAVAGVIANIAEHTPQNTLHMQPVSQENDTTTPYGQHKEFKRQEDNMRRQQAALNRQNVIAQRLGL